MPRKSPPRSPPKARTDRSIPPGFGTVTPYLAIDGCAAAMEFYKKAFGARELVRRRTPDGKIIHGRMRFGDSIVMMSDAFAFGAEPPAGGATVTLHLYSTDVDRLWSRAVSAGAKIAMPLQNQFWGERYGQLVDPFGHHWSLAQVVPMRRAEKKLLEEQAMAMFRSGEHPGRDETPSPT